MVAISKRVSWVPIVLLALLCVYPLVLALQQTRRCLHDDAYITLTYARSLAAGNGFVFNHPPATLGTTTPLYALCVAGLSRCLPSLRAEDLAVFFSAACLIGAGWLIFGWAPLWGLGRRQALIVIAVLYVTTWPELLGMEAYLFAFLLVLGVCLFAAGRPLLAGAVCGLLYLARGEGLLLFPLFMLVSGVRALRERRRDEGWRWVVAPVLLLAGFVVPVTVWFAYSHAAFGHALPGTLGVKISQGMRNPAQTFYQELIHRQLPFWHREYSLARFPWANTWWFLVLIGIAYAIQAGRRWLFLLLWVLLYVAGYSFLGVRAYWWYFFPIEFILGAFAALGLAKSAGTLCGAREFGPFGRIAAVCLVLFVTTNLGASQWARMGDNRRSEYNAAYLRLCNWVNRQTKPGDSIAYIEIGFLGYFTPNRIIDLAGLTMREVSDGAVKPEPASIFRHYEPDYLVRMDLFDWAFKEILDDPRFAEDYEVAGRVKGWLDKDFIIYKRRHAGGPT